MLDTDTRGLTGDSVWVGNYRVPTAQGKQRKQGKWQKEIPVRENTGNLEFFSKHREFCQGKHREFC